MLETDPRGFLSWDIVTRTMFTVFDTYVVKELVHLRRQDDWTARWRPSLRESSVGRPARFPLFPRSSPNLIHDAYTLCVFKELTGVVPEQFENVLEFGGGYGSMCRLFFNLGFSGTYVIFDLPMLSSLQAYYLGSSRIPILSESSEALNRRGVHLVSEARQLWELCARLRRGKWLFIGTWSICETPLNVRNQFLPHVSNFDAFLIAFQKQFGEVNNCDFFARWQEQTSNLVEWHLAAIKHLPGHYYLVGKRRTGDETPSSSPLVVVCPSTGDTAPRSA